MEYKRFPHIYHLEAHLPEKNLHRSYKVWVEEDLFDILVCTNFGRVDKAGRLIRYPVDSYETANKLMGRILRTREKSFSRIGCTYKYVNSNNSN